MESITSQPAKKTIEELQQNFELQSEASRVASAGLDIKGIRELKSLANPPRAVGEVCACIVKIVGTGKNK